MKSKTLIAAMLAACLVSCATGPTVDQMVADATPPKFPASQYPALPDNATSIARAWVKAQLFDPYSAHIDDLGSTMRYGFKNRVTNQWEPAWMISFMVNAKNRFGAYTGARPVFVLMQGKKIVDTSGLEDFSNLL